MQIIPLSNRFHSSSFQNIPKQLLPNNLHFGDYDYDGYPDILLTLSSPQGPLTYLYNNQEF